ncbi:MAG: DUF2339 domain-containing protein, partial [Candidatus Sumerlaeota bacterium]|nr:DUF2339 domain-containing protein [Candidatus Sumerlaeota bacterium]
SFAAHALRPVRIIDDPTLAGAFQFVAVGVITLFALRRNSNAIATMATVFGYLACLFSFWNGLNTFALTASTMLGVATACFYLVRRWHAPYLIAVPATYFIYLLVFVFHWLEGPRKAPGFAAAMSFLVADLTLFGAADYSALIQRTLLPRDWRRYAQVCNSTSAVALGFLVARLLYPDSLSTYYFLFGAILTAASLVYYFTDRDDVLVQVYFVKGSALLTMGLIDVFRARTRWIALAAESLVLLFSAKRSRMRLVEAAMTIVWYVSLWFFFDTLWTSGAFQRPQHIWTPAGIASLAYLAFSAYVFCLYGRWFVRPAERKESDVAPAPDGEYAHIDLSTRQGLALAHGAALGFVSILVAAAHSTNAGHGSMALALLMALLAAVGVAGRHWIPYVALVIPFAAAHVSFWGFHGPTGLTWLNAAAVIAVTLAAAERAYRLGIRQVGQPCRGWLGASDAGSVHLGKEDLPDSARQMRDTLTNLEALLHALWLFALYATFRKVFAWEHCIPLAVATAFGAAALALVFPSRRLADLAALPMVFALPLVVNWARLHHTPDLSARVIDAELIVAGLGAFGFAKMNALWQPLNRRFDWLKKDDVYQWAHLALATIIGVSVIGQVFKSTDLMLVAALFSLAVLGLVWLADLKPAVWFGLAFVIQAHIQCYRLAEKMTSTGDYRFLATACAAGALTIAYVVLARRARPDLPSEANEGLAWGLLALATACALRAMEATLEPLRLMPAAAGVALVVLGLARVPGLKPALWFGLAFVAQGHLRFYRSLDSAGMLADPRFLWLGILVSVITIAYAVLARRARRDLAPQANQTLAWLLGATGLLLLFTLFAKQPESLERYATVFWSLSAIAVFIVGLIDRQKPLRILGLGSLVLLCIPRVFLVDARSDFYRIIAMGALAAVILAVAFLYNKYRDFILKWDEEDQSP